MFEPSGEELDEVRESFGLHELAVEDAKTFHLRPKVEEYETGVQLVILRTARYNHDQDEVDFGEISIFVGPSFVITVRQGVASELHGARTRL
ncbi:MAG TPA: CorA family divalent cation transporter, partial [Jiangellaceae bacterium]